MISGRYILRGCDALRQRRGFATGRDGKTSATAGWLPSSAIPASVKAEKQSHCCHLLSCLLTTAMLHLAESKPALNDAAFMPAYRSQRHMALWHFVTLLRP